MPLSTLSSRMTSTMTHSRDHSWQISKHKASMMLLTLILILRVVISMKKNFFKESSPLYILFWLLHSKQKKGRELVKEFEGDARSIILKLHHYHTKSNVAQHDIITLTTDITNLTLNDSWKGTVRQFLSPFKEKLRLLDSLVPVSDQLPETTRITFLQRAVQQNHDLRQIHVMDSVWRFKTDSTDTLTFETY